MIAAGFPLLSCLILLPLLGALITGLCKELNSAKRVALGFAVIELMIALFLVSAFDINQGSRFQWVEHYAWISSLNIDFIVGVDGISLLFLPLSALLTVLTILASWNSVTTLTRFHFALLLVLEGITLGVFSALDMMLFFLFWELTLPPIFFLIGLWGMGPHRRAAALKYTLYMLFGGVPLLFAIIMLGMNHAVQAGGHIPEDLSFSFPILLSTPLPENLQPVILLLLLLGFGVKAPLIPFHTWLPTTAMEAPTQMTALLTGLKLGVFGILRFALPLAPSAAIEYSWIIGILGVTTLIYGSLIAIKQTNLRSILAYASLSHVGLVIVGIAAFNMQGIQGAIFQLLNFTLIASCLMLMAGFIQHRIGSTEIIHLGGLAKTMPRLATLFFLFAFASIGVPGTSGFPAELLLFIGVLDTYPSLAITAMLGAIIGATYTINFMKRAFWGPVVNAGIVDADDLKSRELAILCIPAVLILIFGLFPNLILNIHYQAAEKWLLQLNSPVKAKIIAPDSPIRSSQ
ncbi:MAG: NADH-quinone oxidoreductase subunit M [Methylovulum sp.]|nr:NADH-quinone oxidoreductase subunit M [Methylovulum sp.]